MSIRNLEQLFRPGSVAVIGASDRGGSVGSVVMRNLISGGFAGPIMPVNPRRAAIAGVLAYPNIGSLPVVPDLGVICTPPETVPGLIEDLGRLGTKAAVVLTAGLRSSTGRDGRSLQAAMLDASRPHLLRILGPNCVGLLVPGIGLNASFAQATTPAGSLAFVSQSGALCTIALDWARERGLGFSHFVSLGDTADVDFGDVIDWLATDEDTRAILLYIESITGARKFLSAARAAARNKPIIAVKAGRTDAAQQAARSHTGALAGGDDVMSAALERAGIVRVETAEELFEAAATLAAAPRLAGDRLAILTNGGGPAVLAVDALALGAGRLAELAPATLAALDAVLPATWSHGNPVDIIGDAPAGRYGAAIGPLLADPGVDAVLAMHAPTAIVPSDEAADGLLAGRSDGTKPLLACWLGGPAVALGREHLRAAGVPVFTTTTGAVQAFSHLVEHRRTQDMLLEVPDAAPASAPDLAAARALIDAVLAEHRTLLNEPEAKALLRAYGIPVVPTEIVAADADAAAARATQLGFPAALKILSHDITHKTDVGGVALNLDNADAVRAAATAMLVRVRAAAPAARIDGFTVQPMARRPQAIELIVGAAEDPIFGPFVLFGQGGTAVEVIRDRAVALPPLNTVLAGHLIQRTRVARLLAGYRDRPPADLAPVRHAVVQVAQMVADLPAIVELDINPLWADASGVLALDARVVVRPAKVADDARLAIRPYPVGLIEGRTLADGRRIELRPIRPEDTAAHQDFFARLDSEDVRFRFFGPVRSLASSEMARFTQIDYDREMAFIAVDDGQTLGVARAVTDPQGEQAEFSVIVRSDQKGRGLGRLLLDHLLGYLRQRGVKTVTGLVLRHNTAMLALVRRAGFTVAAGTGDTVDVSLNL